MIGIKEKTGEVESEQEDAKYNEIKKRIKQAIRQELGDELREVMRKAITEQVDKNCRDKKIVNPFSKAYVFGFQKGFCEEISNGKKH